jgi:Ca-activated chloride channel family protein
LGLLAPIALVALPLLGVIIALYLLKFRRPITGVGSLVLWRSLMRDREANSLWQRLHISPLLLLQLLILCLLILAFARPWVPSSEALGQNAVIVVDVSASMGSVDRDGGLTRLDQAKSKARSIVDGLPDGATAMLIAATDRATVLVPSTDDRSRVRAAIDGLTAQTQNSDMADALKLAGAVAARQANSAVWLLSDGAFPAAAAQVATLPARFTFVQLGGQARPEGNQGITALDLQKGSGGLDLFMQISNSEPVSVSRRLDLLADDVPWSARNVEIGPGKTAEVVVPDVPLSARVVKAQLAGSDALQVDNAAWVVNRASVPANVLLVTDDNKFLELSLSLLPTVNLYKVAPQDYKPDATVDGISFDLTIFDAGVLSTTQTLPAGPLMMFAPQPGNPLVQVTGVVSDVVPRAGQGLTDSDQTARDPLLRFVDLTEVHVARAQVISLPDWAHVVMDSESGPMVIAGEQDKRNVVVFAFDLHDSDLPLQTAFPLLIRNLVTYLSPLPGGGLPYAVPPGEPVSISKVSDSVTSIVLEDPSAREHTWSATGITGSLAYGDTTAPGVYYVSQYAGNKIVAQEAFAVNLFSLAESLTPPNSSPSLPKGAQNEPSGDGNSSSNEGMFRRELWPMVALMGITVLLIEWLFAQRIYIRRALTEWQTRRAARRLS